MSYEVKCEYCGSKVVTEPDMINRGIACSHCKEEFVVPLTNFTAGLVTGTYWIQRKIGTGNISEVFLAKRLADNEKVYLKVLSPCVTPNKKTVEQFMIEMCRSHQVENPNVVSVFETGKMNGHYYLASNYVEGECLDTQIERNGPMSEKDALKLCLKVARILRTCWHDFGIVHRSVRPSNILISDGGEVYVLDVGNSKQLLLDSSTVTLDRLNNSGTLADFMSPEQAQNIVELDCSSDIYSLGATLFYLLTGTKPYTGTDTTQVMLKHLNSPAPNPMKRPGEVSRDTAQLIRSMMDTSPDGRIYSWREVVTRIKQLLRSKTNGSGTETTLKTQLHHTPKFTNDDLSILHNRSKKKSSIAMFMIVAVGIILLIGVVGAGLILAANKASSEVTAPPVRPRPAVSKPADVRTKFTGKRLTESQLNQSIKIIIREYERHPDQFEKYSNRMGKLYERTEDPVQIKVIHQAMRRLRDKKVKYDKLKGGKM